MHCWKLRINITRQSTKLLWNVKLLYCCSVVPTQYLVYDNVNKLRIYGSKGPDWWFCMFWLFTTNHIYLNFFCIACQRCFNWVLQSSRTLLVSYYFSEYWKESWDLKPGCVIQHSEHDVCFYCWQGAVIVLHVNAVVSIYITMSLLKKTTSRHDHWNEFTNLDKWCFISLRNQWNALAAWNTAMDLESDMVWVMVSSHLKYND